MSAHATTWQDIEAVAVDTSEIEPRYCAGVSDPTKFDDELFYQIVDAWNDGLGLGFDYKDTRNAVRSLLRQVRNDAEAVLKATREIDARAWKWRRANNPTPYSLCKLVKAKIAQVEAERASDDERRNEARERMQRAHYSDYEWHRLNSLMRAQIIQTELDDDDATDDPHFRCSHSPNA